ncbi:MAG: helix-hairpin-helix domain-containing protein [Lachnospiraceae bacterium]|nr:helix-hairpin-helix domain-containing protein [Lachnospiraceae bacterium]
MNRKTKKYVKTALILVFFLGAGVWYFFFGKSVLEKQKSDTEVTSILDTVVAEPTISEVSEKEKTEEAVVYVCGAVNVPGIYTLPKNSRLYEAITAAGGFSPEADPAYHNLARSITDGERIYILSASETKEISAELRASGEEGAEQASNTNGILNLNTATAAQLMELPGIGEAKAAAILAYRAKIGQFTDIEEIKNVSGIGDAMFEKIKDKITVK